MRLDGRPLDTVAYDDITGLVADRVVELRTLEYKGELPQRTEGAKKEFLADVSSFANAAGGHIVYGVRTKGGIPVAPAGLPCPNVDDQRQWFENMIRDGLRPQIPGLELHHVSDPDAGTVFILRVPRSFVRPHQIIYLKDYRFYSRNSAGKHRMDVDELRQVYALSDTLTSRIEGFRNARVTLLSNPKRRIPLESGAMTILHLVPFAAFDPLGGIDITRVPDFPALSEPLALRANKWRFSLDGYYKSADGRQDGKISGYTQVFRSGAVEAVDTFMLRDGGHVPSIALEELLVDGTRRYLKLQRSLGVSLPVAVMVTLVGVEGRELAVRAEFVGAIPFLIDGRRTFEDEVVAIPAVLINAYEAAVPQALRPTFDMIWNAGGWARSFNYDEDGKWRLRG